MQGEALRTFGRFTGLVEIGRGGMSVVYRARSPEGRFVALKLLAPHLVTSPSARARFEQEGALGLDHPNIVPVLESGVEQGTPYLVMPYIQGESLEQRVQHCGPLQPQDFLPILEDVARALDYAHKHGVIHRDVKPSNILIQEDGRALLTDFGVARLQNATNYTATRSRIGSVYCMSPEQAKGSYEISRAADIYALGATAYYALTGRYPFVGVSEVAIARQHLEAQPQNPCEVNPLLPKAVGEVILWALQKSPVKRPVFAGTFARAFRAALEQPALPAAPPPRPRISVPSTPDPALSAARWRWAAALMVGGILFAFLFVLALVLSLFSQQSSPPLPTPLVLTSPGVLQIVRTPSPAPPSTPTALPAQPVVTPFTVPALLPVPSPSPTQLHPPLRPTRTPTLVPTPIPPITALPAITPLPPNDDGGSTMPLPPPQITVVVAP